jgi:hypothetical protein
MSLKVILIICACALVAIGLAYWIGGMRASSASDLACVTAHANDEAKVQQAQTEAEQKGRQAQHDADLQQLNDLKGMMAAAQQAAAKAQQTADEATAKNNALNNDLTRLQHEDAKVDKWAGHCLPTSLLASLHPGIDAKAYPSACSRPGDSDKSRIPAHPAQSAAGH